MLAVTVDDILIGRPASVDFLPKISKGTTPLPLHFPCFMFSFSRIIKDNASAATLQDFATSSDPSRIPPPHASTSHWRTYGTVWWIPPPLLWGRCSVLVQQSPPPWPLCHRYYWHREQDLPGIQCSPACPLHNIHKYICPCSMFTYLPLYSVLHLPTTLRQEPSMAFTEQLSWHREQRYASPTDFWESVYCLLTPKPKW